VGVGTPKRDGSKQAKEKKTEERQTHVSAKYLDETRGRSLSEKKKRKERKKEKEKERARERENESEKDKSIRKREGESSSNEESVNDEAFVREREDFNVGRRETFAGVLEEKGQRRSRERRSEWKRVGCRERGETR